MKTSEGSPGSGKRDRTEIKEFTDFPPLLGFIVIRKHPCRSGPMVIQPSRRVNDLAKCGRPQKKQTPEEEDLLRGKCRIWWEGSIPYEQGQIHFNPLPGIRAVASLNLVPLLVIPRDPTSGSSRFIVCEISHKTGTHWSTAIHGQKKPPHKVVAINHRMLLIFPYCVSTPWCVHAGCIVGKSQV